MKPPRTRRDRLLARRLRLLHPGRVGGEGVPPDLPPALARARRAPALAAGRSMYADTIETHDRLAPLAKEEKPAPPPLPYPDTTSARRFGNLARMLGAGFGTRVAAISQRRLRHPRRPGGDHAALLQDLGDSLRAWQADLDARGLSPRVLTLIWSEFGRRPEDNDSGGTDHGAGGLRCSSATARTAVPQRFPGPCAARRRRQPDRHDRLPHGLRDAARELARRRGRARAAAGAGRPLPLLRATYLLSAIAPVTAALPPGYLDRLRQLCAIDSPTGTAKGSTPAPG